MICPSADADFPAILEIINDAAQAYRGTIPADCWQEPYMQAAELAHLRTLTAKPILIGTWATASWAIRFYEKHGFAMISDEEKSRLLRKYWSIPERQVETSVVLAEARGHRI